jgi:hypothetical protein
MADENNSGILDHDRAILNNLEQEERLIENREHAGFGDAARRTRVEGQIDSLDREIRELKENAVPGEG